MTDVLPAELMKEAKTTRAIIFDWNKIKDCTPEDYVYEKLLWLPVSAVTKWQQKLIEMISKRRDESVLYSQNFEALQDVRITQSIVADELSWVLELFGVKP